MHQPNTIEIVSIIRGFTNNFMSPQIMGSKSIAKISFSKLNTTNNNDEFYSE